MRKRLLLVAIWSLAAIAAGGDKATSLVSVHQEEGYSATSTRTGMRTELLAAKVDVEASRAWNPSLPMPLTLAELIERARAAIPKPEGTFVYADPEFRGADLRTADTYLWYWEIHFAFDIDRSVKEQTSSKMVRCFAPS